MVYIKKDMHRGDEMNWPVIIITFLGINLDFMVILLLLLNKYKWYSVFMGNLIGLLFFVVLSFTAGRIITEFTPEWVIGLFGLIPIYMALAGGEEKVGNINIKSPIFATAVTYVSVCSDDNISIFLPILARLSWLELLMTIGMMVILSLMIVLGLVWFGNLKFVKLILERWNELIVKIVYIGIGVYVLIDSSVLGYMQNPVL